MSNTAADLETELLVLKANAKKAFDRFTALHALKTKEVAYARLSESTISRRLGPSDGKKYETREGWLNDLCPIYLRVADLLRKRGLTPTWDEVFGPDVPKP